MSQAPPLANETATGFVPYDVAEHLRTPESKRSRGITT
jgi:hypothetical protein